MDGKCADAYCVRAVAFNDKGEPEKAITDCTDLMRLDPKNVYAYFNRGLGYQLKREHDKAIADYTEAVRLDRGLPTDLILVASFSWTRASMKWQLRISAKRSG